jgi:hypothetical protein
MEPRTRPAIQAFEGEEDEEGEGVAEDVEVDDAVEDIEERELDLEEEEEELKAGMHN